MKRPPAVALAACLTLACGARLPTGPLTPVEGRFAGVAQARVSFFNQVLDRCGEQRAEAARQYNAARGRADHWDFWTVTLGLASDAAAAVIALADSGSSAPRAMVAVSGISVGLSQGIKAASGLENDANRKYQAYAYWNARVAAARADFAGWEPALESPDPPPQALAALDSLTAAVNRRCTEPPDLR